MTMTLVKLSYNSKLVPDPGLVLQTPLCMQASACAPSITDGVHRNENFVEIMPVFSTFSNFFKKKRKKIYKCLCARPT